MWLFVLLILVESLKWNWRRWGGKNHRNIIESNKFRPDCWYRSFHEDRMTNCFDYDIHVLDVPFSGLFALQIPIICKYRQVSLIDCYFVKHLFKGVEKLLHVQCRHQIWSVRWLSDIFVLYVIVCIPLVVSDSIIKSSKDTITTWDFLNKLLIEPTVILTRAI